MISLAEQEVLEDVWQGLYGESWKGLISDDAFAHPAKFSRALIRRIYDHVIEERWATKGSGVVDPFGGVALGAHDAMRHGLNWYGCELESKFVGLGSQNIALWNERFSRMPNWGTARLLQGDSRKLGEILSDPNCCMTWYDMQHEEQNNDRANVSGLSGRRVDERDRQEVRDQGHVRSNEIQVEGAEGARSFGCPQLSLRDGQARSGRSGVSKRKGPLELQGREGSSRVSEEDPERAVRGMPDNAEPLHSPQGSRPLQQRSEEPASAVRELSLEPTQETLLGSETGGQDSAQINRAQSLAQICIASPPYAGNEKSDYLMSDDGKTRRRDEKRGFKQGHGCFRGSEGAYGSSEGQLGALKEGSLASVLAEVPRGECAVPLLPDADPVLIGKFFKRVAKSDGCWLWTGKLRPPDNYGKMLVAPKTEDYAHRASWMLHYGAIPDNLCVLHKCDNPPCVRPDHLFTGTKGDNWRDCVAKGRAYSLPPLKGEENGFAKLTNEQAREIFQKYQTGNYTMKELGREYGVSRHPVYMIVHGKGFQEALGAMPEGQLSISSPPFPQPYTGGGGINVHGYKGAGMTENEDHNIGKRHYQSKGGDRADGNLETLDANGFECAVSSPPYEGSLQGNHNGQDVDKGMAKRKQTGGKIVWGSNANGSRSATGYSPSAANLGNDTGETFWSASRLILEQLHQVIVPGGHAVFVVKAFVRDKKIVDFPGQWAQLCEAVGFKLLHHHRASLVEHSGTQGGFDGDKEIRVERKSFFRRLAEAKGSPRIDHESVLCLERAD